MKQPTGRLKNNLWLTGTAGALALAVIAGYGMTAQPPIKSDLKHSALAEVTQSTALSVLQSTTGSSGSDGDLLTDDEVEALTGDQLDAILSASHAEVSEAQEEFATEVSAADYAMAVAAYDAFASRIDSAIETYGVEAVREHIATSQEIAGASAAPASIGSENAEMGLTLALAARQCAVVYKWQLQTFAWIAIGYGAILSIAGLFASGTIVGLPAGAVLAAAGIGLGATSSFLLWKVDQIRWNSKKVCW